MKIYSIDKNGEVTALIFSSARLSCDENEPADSLRVTLPSAMAETPRRIMAEQDGKLIFSGPVLSLEESFTSGGTETAITAKTAAYLMAESEAEPQCYENPSLPKLFENHALIHGIGSFSGRQNPYYWNYVIQKGRSDWQVIEDFCLYCMDIVPRLRADGVLDCTGARPEGILAFGDGGIPLISVTRRDAPMNRIGALHLQSERGGAYSNIISDREAIEAGISIRRFETVDSWKAQRMINQSARSSRTITVECPGFIDAELKMEASLRLSGRSFGGYTVSSFEHIEGESGERTIINISVS